MECQKLHPEYEQLKKWTFVCFFLKETAECAVSCGTHPVCVQAARVGSSDAAAGRGWVARLLGIWPGRNLNRCSGFPLRCGTC